MEIGLIYSKKDPRLAATKRFVRDYCRQRGILARITETEQPVETPQIVINGVNLVEESTSLPVKKSTTILSRETIARALERCCWSL
jgi:hypothetical protein